MSTPSCTPLVDAVMHAPSEVSVPSYDRGALTASVVHIGVGGFHRAHQARYFDDLANLGETGWGVVGVGLHRPEMGEVLHDQFTLFTLVERGADCEEVRVIGSIVRYLFAPDDPRSVVDVLASRDTRLVTLTVTGDGYFVGKEGAFDADDPGIQHDLAHPAEPRTMVGYLVEALGRRRAAGLPPFTVLSCDNLPESGGAARAAVTGFAALRDPELASWIAQQVAFPSSMVDRITPETSPEVTADVERRFGMPDRWPVVAEPFRQWVIEDDFCAGRPPLDRVGVQFVDDVAPYKRVKARLLNGGHSALGYLGSLLGHSCTDAAMADPVVSGLIERLLRDEIRPLLADVPGLDLDEYVTTTLGRFANPAIGDSLGRLCRRGSTKMPSYLLPSLVEARRRGSDVELLTLAVAAWLRWLQGCDLNGRPMEVVDPRAEELQERARRGGDDARPVLELRDVFGDLVDDEVVVGAVERHLRGMSRETLASVCGRAGSVAA